MKNLNDLSYEELKSLLDNNAKFNGIVFDDYRELLSMELDDVLDAAGDIFRDYSLGNTVYRDYVRFQYYPDIEKINAWINDPETNCFLCFPEELFTTMETWKTIDSLLDAYNYDEISLTRETEEYLNAAYDEYKGQAENIIAAAFSAYYETAEDNDVLAGYLLDEIGADYYTDYYLDDAGRLWQHCNDLLIA